MPTCALAIRENRGHEAEAERILAHDAACRLTLDLTASLATAERNLATLKTRAADAEAIATAAAQSLREVEAAAALLQPDAEALAAGRPQETKRERAGLEAQRLRAAHDRDEATAQARTARPLVSESKADVAAIRAKLVALETVPEPDAEALAPLVAALRAPAEER